MSVWASLRKAWPIWLATTMTMASAAAAAPSASAVVGVTDSEIVIGQSITLQGGKNSYGVDALAGVKLYLDGVNAAGGIHGRKIVVRTLDDDNKGAVAEANARKLVQDGAFVLFGSIEGGPSTAVMKVAAEAKVPFIGPMAGPPALRRPHQPMVFPVRAEHRDEFRALMTWARSTGLKTVGFFHVEGANGQEHLTNVTLIAKDLGMEVVLPLQFKPDTSDADLDAMVSKVVTVKPDIVFNHGSASLYQKLVAKSKAAGSKTTFMAVNSGSSQIAQGLGPLAEGMVFAQVVPSPWEGKRQLTREYQDAMRRANPNAPYSYGSMEGFMTAKLLTQALRAAGKDLSRARLLRALDGARFDLGGVKVEYGAGNHVGSQFVDLSMVTRAGKFMH
jgi:ABC-type branched-subunit amino acid transport system substrate-binding protein